MLETLIEKAGGPEKMIGFVIVFGMIFIVLLRVLFAKLKGKSTLEKIGMLFAIVCVIIIYAVLIYGLRTVPYVHDSLESIIWVFTFLFMGIFFFGALFDLIGKPIYGLVGIAFHYSKYGVIATLPLMLALVIK